MPSTITHCYHHRDVYDICSSSFKYQYPEEFYHLHSVFAQGHDALFFSNFWKLCEFNKKRNQAIYLQDHKFQDFCVEFASLIKDYGLEDAKSLKLLLYGYIMHHILDSYVHPYIIYETGTSGMHELVESYIDKYMMEKREGKDSGKYKVHKMMAKPPRLEGCELKLVNEAFFNTYGFENFGKTYIDALNQVNLFLRLFRYDPTGIKDWGYRLIDKANLTSLRFSFLSYNHDYSGFEYYLNEELRKWFNPCDENITSISSFFELYWNAVEDAAKIISELEIAINDKGSTTEIRDIVPNVSAIHGLSCDLELSFKTLNKINQNNLNI